MQLDMVLRLGVSPDRIVFANACKRPRDIRAAASKQVRIIVPALPLTALICACTDCTFANWLTDPCSLRQSLRAGQVMLPA